MFWVATVRKPQKKTGADDPFLGAEALVLCSMAVIRLRFKRYKKQACREGACICQSRELPKLEEDTVSATPRHSMIDIQSMKFGFQIGAARLRFPCNKIVPMLSLCLVGLVQIQNSVFKFSESPGWPRPALARHAPGIVSKVSCHMFHTKVSNHDQPSKHVF